ncbi:MAG: flippase-like domain-containing protein [Hyphomicrobiales bacterium]|nr:MAG: flippase-like domain-containing protein [Hyphomicrobiales bacterium]
MSAAPAKSRVVAIALLKIGITIAILWFLVNRLSTGGMLASLLGIAPWAITLCLSLVTFQLILSALRTQVILSESVSSVDVPTMIRISFAGAFYSQTMVSFVGGDAARIMLLAQHGVPATVSSYVIVLDRLVGLAAQLLVLLAVSPALLLMRVDVSLYGSVWAFALAGLVCVCGIAFFAHLPQSVVGRDGFVARHLRGLSDMNITIMRNRASLIRTILLSTAIVVINMVCIYVYFRGIGVDVGAMNVLVISPAVFLVSMLPISIAGWGVREGAMSAGFALVGVDPAQSLVVSIAFGLTLALVSLPGGFTGFRVLARARGTGEV